MIANVFLLNAIEIYTMCKWIGKASNIYKPKVGGCKPFYIWTSIRKWFCIYMFGSDQPFSIGFCTISNLKTLYAPLMESMFDMLLWCRPSTRYKWYLISLLLNLVLLVLKLVLVWVPSCRLIIDWLVVDIWVVDLGLS